MRRLTSVILAVLLLAGIAACGNPSAGSSDVAGTQAAAPSKTREAGNGLKIVTTIFPEYDWVKVLLGDQADAAEIELLLDNGTEMHSYQPSVQDMIAISECDLFIYVGGESDGWVEDALKDPRNPDRIAISLMEVLGDAAKEEEHVEGMEEDHEEGHEEEKEYDEHVWLSLRNASLFTEAISKALQTLDPENAAMYQANADTYKKQLSDLDAAYTEAIGSAVHQTILFGDRFPFRYLTDDYELSYYAAFSGCSAETEASFDTVIFLAGKVDEMGLPAVLTIDRSDGRIAQTIIDNTQTKSAQILNLDSMQATTSQDLADGATYLSIMEKNLDTLKTALGE